MTPSALIISRLARRMTISWTLSAYSAERFTLVRLRDSVSCWLFFFQAEDGIRDYKVTGVQTCALPISLVLHALRRLELQAHAARHHQHDERDDPDADPEEQDLPAVGDEERDEDAVGRARQDRKSVV